MYSDRSTRALPRVGFPIRKSSDQRMVSSFPRLIAAAHVLHRLLAPRHPPCALSLLTGKNTLCVAAMEFSRCAWARAHHTRTVRQPAGLSKLNSVDPADAHRRCGYPKIRRGRRSFPGESACRTVRRPSTGRTPTGVRAPVFPRKEVIQPQLPLRLPCYDFTPIIDPTFDGCLPEGLAHRLRVLPTFVV
jgi:hypothetical protein